MATITWDDIGERVFESGIDKGVLYLPNGLAVAWNGLTNIVEESDKEAQPVYFDGMKTNDIVVLGDFAATMSAMTYPDEFLPLEGYATPRNGVYIGDQPLKTFALCYRTLIGNDVEGERAGYKLHIIYNLVAIPSGKSYGTLSADPTTTVFEWSITAVPEEAEYYRPTAQIIVDSRTLDPDILEALEDMLYGSDTEAPILLPMPELIAFLTDWYRIRIIDHGDGTFSAISNIDGLIVFGADPIMDLVTINEATTNPVVIVGDSYELSDTFQVGELTDIIFVDNGDGTWTATTDDASLFTETVDGVFEIREANPSYINPYTWRVTYA